MAYYLHFFALVYYSTHDDLNAVYASHITINLVSQIPLQIPKIRLNAMTAHNETRAEGLLETLLLSPSSSIAFLLIVLVSLKPAFRPDSGTKLVKNKGNRDQSQSNES